MLLVLSYLLDFRLLFVAAVAVAVEEVLSVGPAEWGLCYTWPPKISNSFLFLTLHIFYIGKGIDRGGDGIS